MFIHHVPENIKIRALYPNLHLELKLPRLREFYGILQVALPDENSKERRCEELARCSEDLNIFCYVQQSLMNRSLCDNIRQ